MKPSLTFKKRIALLAAVAIISLTTFAQSGQKWATGGLATSTGDFLGTTNSMPIIFKTNNQQQMVLTPAGFLGLGVTNPTQMLDISGNARVAGTTNFIGNMTVGGTVSIAGTLAASGTNPLIFQTNNTTWMQISPTGNIGIGTTNPQYKLDVMGAINATQLTVNGSPVTNFWNTSGNSIFYSAGNVGIGTSTPASALDVANNLHVGGTSMFGGNMTLGGALSSVANITTTGRIGIGVANPVQNLDVNGGAHFSGAAAIDGNTTIGGNINITGTITSSGNLAAACVSTACLQVAGTTTLDVVRTNKITSDGLITFGDSSLVYDPSGCRLYNDGTATIVKGVAIGIGTGSLHAANSGTRGIAPGSLAIGANVRTNNQAINSVIIGSSPNPTDNSSFFTLTKPNSFAVGFKSDVPTLFVGPGNGAGTIGNVGIGTTTPAKTLEVKGTIRAGDGGSNYIDIWNDSQHNIIDANGQDLLINYYATKNCYIGPGSLFASGVFTAQNDAYFNGNVGIGTTNATSKLTVYGDFAIVDNNGKTNFKIYGNGANSGYVRARDVLVDLETIPDYVFEKSYKLNSISEVEAYIKANKHLPNVPSAKEIKENGLPIGVFQQKLLEKVEELTLYVIELKKENEAMKAKMELLGK